MSVAPSRTNRHLHPRRVHRPHSCAAVRRAHLRFSTSVVEIFRPTPFGLQSSTAARVTLVCGLGLSRSAMKFSCTKFPYCARPSLRSSTSEPLEDRSQDEATVEQVLHLSELAMSVLPDPERKVRRQRRFDVAQDAPVRPRTCRVPRSRRANDRIRQISVARRRRRRSSSKVDRSFTQKTATGSLGSKG